jgi:predicted dienelactone hydrolase
MVRRVRAALSASLVVCVTLASAPTAFAADNSSLRAQPSADRSVRLTLPAPTGPYPVGTADVHLIDRSRANPWTATPAYRELMVSLWYPATDVRGFPRAPQMAPGAAAHFGSAAGSGATLYDIPAGAVDFSATRTSGHEGAPVARHRHPFPVVVYSPGAGDPRTWATTVVQDLASRGYLPRTTTGPRPGRR